MTYALDFLLSDEAKAKLKKGVNRKRLYDSVIINFKMKCRCVRKERVRATLDRWDIPRDFAAWFVAESEFPELSSFLYKLESPLLVS
jgi:hypothetical protein